MSKEIFSNSDNNNDKNYNSLKICRSAKGDVYWQFEVIDKEHLKLGDKAREVLDEIYDIVSDIEDEIEIEKHSKKELKLNSTSFIDKCNKEICDVLRNEKLNVFQIKDLKELINNYSRSTIKRSVKKLIEKNFIAFNNKKGRNAKYIVLDKLKGGINQNGNQYNTTKSTTTNDRERRRR